MIKSHVLYRLSYELHLRGCVGASFRWVNRAFSTVVDSGWLPENAPKRAFGDGANPSQNRRNPA